MTARHLHRMPSARSRRREEAETPIRPTPSTSSPRRLLLLALVLLLIALLPTSSISAEPAAAFDAANKLYEQGRHREAAAAYESLLKTSPQSESLLFNLGNARFKAGETGRAIAAWREAERLAPREPGIRFNLQFARRKVSGQETSAGTLGGRTLAALTANEWAALAAVALWIWCGLLALRELRPALRPTLSGYTATAGGIFLALAVCVGAATSRNDRPEAVVTTPEAILRSGPLEEAKVLHQLRDGTEVVILDRKTITIASQPQTWLDIRDAANHRGWIKNDQVAEIGTAR